MNGAELEGLPRLRLDFYETAVFLTRWQEDGRSATYPVSIHDVVSACTNVALGSGLLPPETLFWGRQGSETRMGIYVPARRWRVQVEGMGEGLTQVRIPLPPLLFVGVGASYSVFALRRRPRDERERLYEAPCPNVNNEGVICRGNVPFPLCGTETIQAALRLFLEGSAFNGHQSNSKCRSQPDDVRQLWAALAGKKRFPLKELVPLSYTVGHLL